MNKKQEYYFYNLTNLPYLDLPNLNKLGIDGWELVCINNNDLIFKRELE